MARPDRAFALDMDKASLDDLAELSDLMGSIGDVFNADSIRKVKHVIGLVSTYTEAEVGKLTITELKQVMEAIRTGKTEVDSAAVPLPTSASSPDTPGATPTGSRGGRARAQSPNSGASPRGS